MKYEDGMLIVGKNDIFCGHNVVIFSVWVLQLTVFKYLVASQIQIHIRKIFIASHTTNEKYHKQV